jgi:hypothetical protein
LHSELYVKDLIGCNWKICKYCIAFFTYKYVSDQTTHKVAIINTVIHTKRLY